MKKLNVKLMGWSLATLITIGLLPQKAQGQARVERYIPTAASDNSVVYALPITKLYALVEVEHLREVPGPFALYATKYLGVKDPVMQSRDEYHLKSASLGSYGEADPAHRYTVQFRSNSNAPYVYLTEDGLLCAINTDYQYEGMLPKPSTGKKSEGSDVDPFASFSAMSEEYVQATSQAKQAEIAAREIFRLRESRVSIVSGEAEQPFPDGEAMKIAIGGLDRQERALTEKFVGHKESSTREHLITDLTITKEESITLLPGEEGYSAEESGTQTSEKIVAFRFSKVLGLLEANDLRGEPIYLEIKVIDRSPILTDKEQTRKERSLKGLIYSVPGKVEAKLTYLGQRLASGTFDVAQLGEKEALAPALFNSRKGNAAITFYPQTGAIRQVSEMQE